MEGARALTDDPALLTVFYELGLRAISLTYNHKIFLPMVVLKRAQAAG